MPPTSGLRKGRGGDFFAASPCVTFYRNGFLLGWFLLAIAGLGMLIRLSLPQHSSSISPVPKMMLPRKSRLGMRMIQRRCRGGPITLGSISSPILRNRVANSVASSVTMHAVRESVDRHQLVQEEAKMRETEDKLLRKLATSTKNIPTSVGSAEGCAGLSADQIRIAMESASSILKELPNAAAPNTAPPTLVSLHLQVDPMPWWSPEKSQLALSIAQMCAEPSAITTVTAGGAIEQTTPRNVAFLFPEGADLSHHCGPEGAFGARVKIGHYPVLSAFGNSEISLQTALRNSIEDAEVVFVLAPEINSVGGIEALASLCAAPGRHVVVIDGKFPASLPTEQLGRQVRARAKECFPGGVMRMQVVVEAMALKGGVEDMEEIYYTEFDTAPPKGKGELYELPRWLKEAGYKGTGNLAITGNSGTGKSSLNNAVRGLKPRDNNAAAVGVKETTLEPTGYTFPATFIDESRRGVELKLWDLPGAGTPRFPLANYIRKMGIRFFDLVVVVAAQRFTETDLALMDELRENGVPFVAVRSKIDLEVRNAEQDSGVQAEDVLEQIRSDIRRNSLLTDDRIFLLSSRRATEYDFQRFLDSVRMSLRRALDIKLARAMNREIDVRILHRAI